MKHIWLFIFLLWGLLSSRSWVTAEELRASFPEEHPILTLVLPDNWRSSWQKVNGTQFLSLEPQDKSLFVQIAPVSEITTLEEVAANVTPLLEKLTTNLTINPDSWQQGMFNEMPIVYVEATGASAKNGKVGQLLISFLEPAPKQLVLLLIGGAEDTLRTYQGDIHLLLSSFQPYE